MIRQLTFGKNALVRQTEMGHLMPLKPLLTLRLGNHSALADLGRKLLPAAMANVAFNST